ACGRAGAGPARLAGTGRARRAGRGESPCGQAAATVRRSIRVGRSPGAASAPDAMGNAADDFTGGAARAATLRSGVRVCGGAAGGGVGAMNETLVVKVGGSLYDLPDLADRLRRWLSALAAPRVLLVPGGGPTADVIRTFDQRHRLGEEASH